MDFCIFPFSRVLEYFFFDFIVFFFGFLEVFPKNPGIFFFLLFLFLVSRGFLAFSFFFLPESWNIDFFSFFDDRKNI